MPVIVMPALGRWSIEEAAQQTYILRRPDGVEYSRHMLPEGETLRALRELVSDNNRLRARIEYLETVKAAMHKELDDRRKAALERTTAP